MTSSPSTLAKFFLMYSIICDLKSPLPLNGLHSWVGKIMVTVDHFSRRVVGCRVFESQPTAKQVTHFLGCTIGRVGCGPKYTVTDKGTQFWCERFKVWCKRRGIKSRYGAVGKYGSIAVIERFMRTLKSEWARRILVPMNLRDMRAELARYIAWYNEHRPHEHLQGRTPNEVYFASAPANEEPRYEPRRKWPRKSLCASPQAKVKGRCGVRLELVVSHLEGRKHLPVVEIRPVA